MEDFLLILPVEWKKSWENIFSEIRPRFKHHFTWNSEALRDVTKEKTLFEEKREANEMPTVIDLCKTYPVPTVNFPFLISIPNVRNETFYIIISVTMPARMQCAFH